MFRYHFEIKNKDVMIVGDSIVRGNTSQEIVKMVKDFGANKVYFVSACPPLINPCFYGVDIPTRSELIASNNVHQTNRKIFRCGYINVSKIG